LIIKFSITAIAVIENLWSHGRGKVMSKLDFAFRTIKNEEKKKNVWRREMANATGEEMGVPAS